jgi:hypothetical protein
MARENRAELIEKYRQGPGLIAAAVEGLSDAELDFKPADGGWSPREVIHHTADSEMTSAIRVRRLIAEDNPQITGYDGDEFARRLGYATRAVGPSLDAIRSSRSTTLSILDGIDEDGWSRAGTHSEMGAYSMDLWLEIYSRHCHEHADQIARALAEAKGVARA